MLFFLWTFLLYYTVWMCNSVFMRDVLISCFAFDVVLCMSDKCLAAFCCYVFFIFFSACSSHCGHRLTESTRHNVRKLKRWCAVDNISESKPCVAPSYSYTNLFLKLILQVIFNIQLKTSTRKIRQSLKMCQTNLGNMYVIYNITPDAIC